MTMEEEILGYFDIWDEFNDSGKFTITKYFFIHPKISRHSKTLIFFFRKTLL